MITAIVLYDLPPHIGRDACMAHFQKIAPDFLSVPGLVRKQFIYSVAGGVAGGSYLWESLEAAKAFYSGPWHSGIVERYGAPPRISYFETFAVAEVAARLVVPMANKRGEG
jgi:hypothetical protein